MKNILTSKEIRLILSRIKEEDNPIIVASLISRIFYRSKKTKKIIKAIKAIDVLYENYWDDFCSKKEADDIVWLDSGIDSFFKIEPCQMNKKCIACKTDVCTAQWCIYKEHNHSSEMEEGWVCSGKCFDAVCDAHPCFDTRPNREDT
jgi:hypothetical protein